VVMSRLGVDHPVAYVLPGIVLWWCLHEAGVEPTLAGVVLGLLTPARPRRGRPVLVQLEGLLHPVSSFVIVPIFALANAGIHVDGDLLGDAITSPITLGIVFGYVVGKPLGVLAGTWVASRPWLRGSQRSLSWPVIAGAGAVAGLGFTVSLLISSLAFTGRELEEAKIGVLATAILATLVSWGVFRVIARLPAEVRARQLAGTAEELLDLYDDVDPERDHVRGSDAAPVTLLEYGDYECPYCGQAEDVIRQLLESFGDELRYVWRHLPLNDVHPSAQMAAEASEAAGAQGAFWEMHDRLLDHQDELMPFQLRQHAEALDLDVDRFWHELRSRKYNDRVTDDVASADASGVAGTPTFFINGRRHHGAYDIDTLTRAVRTARGRERIRRAAESEADPEPAR